MKSRGRKLCGVGGARRDLKSDFYRRRKIAINEEASLLRRQELSSIKHQDVS